MKAFILGAGLGTRLMPLTKDTPKPLLPILGKPCIFYILSHLKNLGIKEAIINIHHASEKYQKILGNESQGLKIIYSHEKELLGSGGGLKKAESLLKDTFIVYNGDVLCNADLNSAIEFHKKSGNIATLLLIKDGKRGDIKINGNKEIIDIKYNPNPNSSNQYNFTGIHILEPEIFKYIPENQKANIIDVYINLIKQGIKINGLPIGNCYWKDIGTLESYKAAQEDLLQGKYNLIEKLPSPE